MTPSSLTVGLFSSSKTLCSEMTMCNMILTPSPNHFITDESFASYFCISLDNDIVRKEKHTVCVQIIENGHYEDQTKEKIYLGIVCRTV